MRSIALPLALLWLLGGCGAGSEPDREIDWGAPIAIAEQGNFFVGGREVQTESGPLYAEAMYVQYQVPAEQTQPYPVVFIHGGGSSGSYWWSTLDGREGWATLFLRMGYPVYVVDRPAVGRSPYYAEVDGPRLAGPSGMPPADPNLPPPPKVKEATRRVGSGEPGSPEAIQQASGRQSALEVPFGAPVADMLRVSARADRNDQAAGAALLDRIGPAIILTHSRAGPVGWLIADARPDLVKAVVAVEPSGPPFYNLPPIGRRGDPVARPFGITYAPLTFEPAVRSAEDFGELEQVAAPDEYKGPCWLPKETKHRLVNLAKVPVMVMTGGASYHAPYDYCTVTFLRNAGVSVEAMPLDEMGIDGNTHGMMAESNSLELAKIVSRWLEKTLGQRGP